MRRSEEEAVEVIKRGISRVVTMDGGGMADLGRLAIDALLFVYVRVVSPGSG